jgi:hypothetical protein
MEPSEDQMKGSKLTFAYGVFRWIKRGEPPAAPPPKR